MKQIFFLMTISFFGCSSSSEAVYNTVAQTTPMYFPPIGMDVWQTTTAQSLNWDISKQAGLLNFLQSKTFKIVYDFGR
jgi:predicted membrane-bound dolichyl-phosphate-mannose-protein mannosyltransferase